MIARTLCGIGAVQCRTLRSSKAWSLRQHTKHLHGTVRAARSEEATVEEEELPEVEVLVRGEVQKRSFLKQAEVKEYVGVDETHRPETTFDEMDLDKGLLVRTVSHLLGLNALGFEA